MLTNLLRRLARQFQSWTDNLPDGPFEGELTDAALILSQNTRPYLAAEIDVKAEKLDRYISLDPTCLTRAEARRLRRFFTRRGIFELRAFGLTGLIIWTPVLYRAASRSAERLEQAQRILNFLNKDWPR